MKIDFLSLQPFWREKNFRSFLPNVSIVLNSSLALAIPLTLANMTLIETPRSIATELQLVQNLSPQEVNLRAKQFTVRIDGEGTGTGVIIDESDTSYIVLTNWHVVQKTGEYSVQTIDGRNHAVTSVRQLANLDLAVLQFERNQNYQLAEVGNSNSLVEGQDIYFAGYPGELRKEDNRYYRFFSASLVSILPEATNRGYSLVYNGEAFPGMSGGPVLDNRGFLVGIHGETNIHAVTGGTSNYAIPINRYQTAMSQLSTASNSNSSDSNNETAVSEDSTTVQTDANASVTSESANSASSDAATKPSAETSVEVEAIEQAESVENSATADATTNSDVSRQNAESEPDSETNDELSSVVSVPTLGTADANSAPPQSPNSSRASSPATRSRPKLLSSITGIDYTPLKESLSNQKWQQADRQTLELITRIIDTAKRQNRQAFITVNDIADYACSDMYTIDSLWQEYTDNKFGFTPQQEIWQNTRQKSGFSLNAWRSFATKIGWKKGNVDDSGGYLFYEQLTFEPKTAPQGHLPWWFAASEENQNVIKTIFNRCSLQEVPEIVEPDSEKKEDRLTEEESSIPNP